MGKEHQESNREVFARLYDEYLPRVYRYVHYKVNDVPLTEDLTSSVFEKALANFGRYSKDKAAFSTWIFAIARNAVIDYYRTSRRRETVELDDSFQPPSVDPSPQEVLEAKEERECLRLCIAKLSTEEQEIIHLKFGAELNNREIAKMTGLSESNVGTKLFRAVKKLRGSFQEMQNG